MTSLNLIKNLLVINQYIFLMIFKKNGKLFAI